MNTTYSGAEAARRLGTSIPRVVRHAKRLGLDSGPGGRLRLTPAMLRRLEADLGRTPRAPGLSAAQTQVLAALARAPLGLTSARVVALQARVAPATASKALRMLARQGLVRREPTTIAQGRARRVELIHANRLGAEWDAVAPVLNEVRPKARPAKRRASGRSGSRHAAKVEGRASSRAKSEVVVPRRLRHLFWNTAPSQLVVSHGGPYIARRLLTTHDFSGLSWGARNLSSSDWRQAASARGLDPKVRALARNLAEWRDGQ
jgi:DNA-binding MarR family transcriptional regulator